MELNSARRRVTNYFAGPLTRAQPYLKKREKVSILQVDGRGIWFEIVEPMEYELNHGYNKRLFREVEALVGRVPLIPRSK